MFSPDTVPRFLLSVWRPARPARPLAAFPDGESTALPFDPDLLYEQVYAWSPREDVWGSISDSYTTNTLRHTLVDGFNPYLDPNKRSMQHFKDAVAMLGETLQGHAANISWSDCEHVVEKSGQQTVLRSNTTLALYWHLRWVVAVFEHLPGASVTVR